MISLPSTTRVFLAPGNTDMRKEISALSILVESALELDPFSGHLFAFCNRKRTVMKILFWDRNGFALYQKRLEKHRFKWPESPEDVLEVDSRDLAFLLEGLDLRAVQPHGEVHYSSVI